MYKLCQAIIDLKCDLCEVVRTSITGNSLGLCLREAQERGWLLRNSDKSAMRLLTYPAKKCKCYCPECHIRKKSSRALLTKEGGSINPST